MKAHDKNLLTLSRMARAEQPVIDETLRRVHIGLSVPTDTTPGEWVSAKTAANLLVRLYPRVYIAGSPDQVIILTELMLSIRPDAEVVDGLPSELLDVLLLVGQPSSQGEAKERIYFDSDGWLCRVSRNSQPFSRGAVNNPLAAAAAACFAANEAFKIVFSSVLTDSTIADSFVLSLWDYSLGNSSTAQEPLPPVDIGEVWLAGVGAVGNGFLYALSLAENVSGVIHCADNRTVDESNVQRYVLVKDSNIRHLKVDVATQIETGTLRIDPISKTINACFDEFGGMDTLICAVDTIQARRDIQARLPRLILNAWTRMDEFAVTRHIFGSPYRCLSCLYDKGKVKDQRDNIAEATGLSLEEVTALIRGNVGLSTGEISRIENHRELPAGSLRDWIGRTIQSLYQEGICGGQVITTDTGEETVPIAHTSALAGILLAVELVKERMGHPLEHKVQFEMSVPPHRYLLQPEFKAKNSTCICSDEVYIKTYEDKWKLTHPK